MIEYMSRSAKSSSHSKELLGFTTISMTSGRLSAGSPGRMALSKVSLETSANQSNWSDAVCLMLITPEFENTMGFTSGMSTASLPCNS